MCDSTMVSSFFTFETYFNTTNEPTTNDFVS